ncbi:MAG: winged helix-turn-helix domain-containing protein [Coriobacteriales bacterium]|jgi:molybdate transport system regulatory protein
MSNYDKLSIDVRLSIIENGNRDEGTLGKGVFSLLQGITEFGSLNRAAKNLGMAYSKAWRIVKETEAGFGFLLINRDGARGSTLTEDGKRLVEVYKTLQDETEAYVNKRFRELL